jgi:hypothetical protein
MLLQAEALIVGRLREAVAAQVRVAPWPDRPLDFSRPQNLATIFVRFAGIDLAAAWQGQPQQGQVRFELRFLLKDLRSHQGAYQQMAAAQRALTGMRFAPEAGYTAGSGGLQLLQSSLVEREEGRWDWGMVFAANVIYLV